MENPTPAALACDLPPALDEGALLATVDDAADDATGAHLRACAACAARARMYADLHIQLRRHLFRLFCPPAEKLAALQQHALDPARAAAITQHLCECPHCTREMQLLGALLGESPPPGTHPDDSNDQRAGPADDKRC